MNLLDKALLELAPAVALKRARSREIARNMYEAAKPSKHHKHQRDRTSPTQRAGAAAEVIRERARYLEQNYDLAESVLNVITANVVGAEVLPEPQVKDTEGKLHEDFNGELSQWWKVWSECPEVACEHDYHSGARMHFKNKIRDGEMFQQYVEGAVPGLRHGTEIPLSIEHIEADFLPVDFTEESRNIVQSIQRNAWGKANIFWALKHHPGDMGLFRRFTSKPDKPIDAANMLHDKTTKHFRQNRGISTFASSLQRFDDIKFTEESERIAARCASAMIGVRKYGNEEDFDEDEKDDTPLTFEPGSWHDIGPEDSIEVHSNNRPNNALIPFLDEAIRKIAGSTGTSFSAIAKKYGGNFAAQRQELVETWVSYGLYHQDFKRSKVIPDWSRLVKALIQYRLIKVPGNVDKKTLFDVDVPRPPMPWIDPEKEMKAAVGLVDAQLESDEHIMRTRGRTPAVVKQQIERSGREIKQSEPQADEPKVTDETEGEEIDE